MHRWLGIAAIVGVAVVSQAAEEVTFFAGFETQNLYEYDQDTTLTVTHVQDDFDSQWEGVEDWSLEMGSGSAELKYWTSKPFDCATDTEATYGAYIAFDGDVTPATAFPFLRICPEKSLFEHLTLWLMTDNTVRVYDANGSVVGGNVFYPVEDAWYLIELRMLKANSPDGYAYIYIDGELAFTATGQDFYNGVGPECALGIIGRPGIVAQNWTTTRCGSVYTKNDTTASSIFGDTGGYQVVGPYQTCNQDNDTDDGDDLDTGWWSYVGETPFNTSNDACFTTVGDVGVKACDETGACDRRGLLNDSRLFGADYLQAVSWVFLCGTGGMYPAYGKCDTADPNVCVKTVDSAGGVCDYRSFSQYYIQEPGDANCPTVADYVGIGFEGRSVLGGCLYEAWAFALQTVKGGCPPKVNAGLLPCAKIGNSLAR